MSKITEKSNIEDEDVEEEEEEETIEETPKVRRVPIDAEGNVAIDIVLPAKTWKNLKKIAFEKEISRSAVIREALKDYFEKVQKQAEVNPEATIPDEDLNEILTSCTKYSGGFEIDGEDGFIETMKANKFKLKDLTPEQWKRVQEKISMGYSGYTFKPSLEEFAEKFDILEPTKEQREWLSTETEEEE
jgi:hypothetical protein